MVSDHITKTAGLNPNVTRCGHSDTESNDPRIREGCDLNIAIGINNRAIEGNPGTNR